MNERMPREPATEEIIGEIKHGPFSGPMHKRILEKFGRTAFGRSSGCMEFEDFVKRLKIEGDVCLEIGTMHGITAVILSQFFKEVVCVSVDIPAHRKFKYDIVHYLGIKNITFYDVHDNEEKKRVVDTLKFDFAYVDGDHARDTRSDFELVKRCGSVLFHEYWPIQPAVWNLVNSLPEDEVTRAHYECFAYWKKK